jgi:tetratricopeptide (TPR) repeat protein
MSAAEESVAKAVTAYRKHDLSTAESLLKDVIAQPPTTNANVLAEALNDLALVYEEENKIALAETTFRSALAAREKLVGTNSPMLVPILDNLAALERSQRRYLETISLYKRVLAILEAAPSTAPQKLAASLNNLALTFQAAQEYPVSEVLLQRAISIVEKLPPPQHDEVVTLMSNLAEIYGVQQKYAQSESLYRKALEIESHTISFSDARMAATENRLAALLRDQGKFEDAQPFVKDSLAHAEKTGDVSILIPALNNMAMLYREMGQRSDAEALYQRVLDLRMKDPAASVADLAAAYRNLGTLKREEEDYDAALKYYRAGEEALSKSDGDLDAKAELAADMEELYRQQGQFANAEDSLRRSIKEYEAEHGETSRPVQSAWNDLALLYEQQNLLPKAESAYRKSLALAQSIFGADSAGTVLANKNLARILMQQNHAQEAADLYKTSIAILEHSDKVDTRRLAATLRDYAVALRATNNPAAADAADAKAAQMDAIGIEQAPAAGTSQ